MSILFFCSFCVQSLWSSLQDLKWQMKHGALHSLLLWMTAMLIIDELDSLLLAFIYCWVAHWISGLAQLPQLKCLHRKALKFVIGWLFAYQAIELHRRCFSPKRQVIHSVYWTAFLWYIVAAAVILTAEECLNSRERWDDLHSSSSDKAAACFEDEPPCTGSTSPGELFILEMIQPPIHAEKGGRLNNHRWNENTARREKKRKLQKDCDLCVQYCLTIRGLNLASVFSPGTLAASSRIPKTYLTGSQLTKVDIK